uniref:Uncharacterized protein n=1 Tax=Sphaerodactylus townsendi TaxID=933632 RepID=A0ACB8GE62_9SAUR
MDDVPMHQAAFAHLALAFRCDMFTLRQRVQIEERTRDAAEENIQQELGECQVTLQEARMSWATEVMVQHVENLKRHHQRKHAELEEMKRLIQQNSQNRQLAEIRDSGEQRLKHLPIRTFQQGSVRRRISIAVVPKQVMQFHIPPSERGSEREAVQTTPVAEKNPERQLHCLQENSDDSYFILHKISSSPSHQSHHGPNNIEFGMDGNHCTEGKETEFQKRSTVGKTDKEESIAESDSEDLGEENEELEQNALM